LAQIFPKWTNKLPAIVLIAVVLGGVFTVGFFWYFGSPEYTDVGYRPLQPVPYSHKLHVGELGMDCRYCHTGVERSAVAMVPPTQTCMNCHTMVAAESVKLISVRESWADKKPLQWVRIHKVPDYAYFNHKAHISAGVGCESCHGNIAAMEVVQLEKSLSMGWCLSCHKNPEPHIRRPSELTVMNWQPPPDQAETARQIIKEKKINPPIECSGCHR